jgi:hypothetical protein
MVSPFGKDRVFADKGLSRAIENPNPTVPDQERETTRRPYVAWARLVSAPLVADGSFPFARRPTRGPSSATEFQPVEHAPFGSQAADLDHQSTVSRR